jgi:hypothetical protein
MLILIIVLLLLAWFGGYIGPRYYPAYASRYRRYPLWGGRSNILLVVLGILIVLWLLGIIQFGGLHTPFVTHPVRLR